MYENAEELLAPYAPMLAEFGRRHGFQQETFRHGMPMWRFFVVRPGVNGHVDVKVNMKGEVCLVKHWFLENPLTRGEPSETRRIESPLINLEQALTDAITDIRNRIQPSAASR